MKTQSLLVLTCSLLLITLFSCKEENKERTQQEPKIIESQEAATQNISEEKKEASLEVKEQETKDDAPINLLDKQAKVYTDIFGKLGGVEELQGIEGYMDLVKKMDATPETKKQLTEHYELYSKSLDPEKKLALKAQLNAMLLKATKQ